MSKLTILAAFMSLTACAVDEPVEEATTESKLLSTCDWGGDWGWTDPWAEDFSFEVFAEPDLGSSCGDDPWDDGFGGGLGDNQLCSWPVQYTGSNVKSNYGDPVYAQNAARSDALNDAKRSCLSSGWVCTPKVTSFDVRDGGCVIIGYQAGAPRYECSATATVTCSYQ